MDMSEKTPFPKDPFSEPELWVCATGWRLALYLCSPSPALGLGVVADLVAKVVHSWVRKVAYCICKFTFIVEALSFAFKWNLSGEVQS